MSKIAFEMRDEMDCMSEEQFEDTMGLSKTAFIEYLDDASADEIRCAARLGERAPEFSAHKLNADAGISKDLFALSDVQGAPSALIFGSYTCPIFRRQSDSMKELIAHYESAIQFVFVYVLEAHPTDGWNTQSNKEAGVMYSQPINMEERAKIAGDWRDAYGFESTIVLDWPDNRINLDYAGSPERLYVLDADGMVTFKSEQGPYYDSHLEDWAAALKQSASASTSE